MSQPATMGVPDVELSIAGEISEVSYEHVEAALRPLLQRRFQGDPTLRFAHKHEWDELRIEARGFDMMFTGHLFASSFQLGSLEDAIAFYREISAALTQHRIWHHIEIMVREPDGSWSDVLVIP